MYHYASEGPTNLVGSETSIIWGVCLTRHARLLCKALNRYYFSQVALVPGKKAERRGGYFVSCSVVQLPHKIIVPVLLAASRGDKYMLSVYTTISDNVHMPICCMPLLDASKYGVNVFVDYNHA